MSRTRDHIDQEPKTRVGMLDAVSRNARRQDEVLARYYAYRCHVWKAQNPDKNWADLAALLDVEPPVVTALQRGRNGSRERMNPLARALGPTSLDEFEKLARAWAEKYPAWKSGETLPSPLGYTGDPLIDGLAPGAIMFSDGLHAAARALPGLMRCTTDEARDAAISAWNLDPNPNHDWFYWLTVLRGRVDSMRKASGERPSSRHKLP